MENLPAQITKFITSDKQAAFKELPKPCQEKLLETIQNPSQDKLDLSSMGLGDKEIYP